jgi:hypothetical protein
MSRGSCQNWNQDPQGSQATKFEGTWVRLKSNGVDLERWTFKGNKIVVEEQEENGQWEFEMEGTFTYADSTITLFDGGYETYPYTLVGNTLTIITSEDNPLVFTKS